jgi:fatty-acyl-CoA synthase
MKPGLTETVRRRLLPEARTIVTLAQQGVVRPSRPDRLLRILLAWRRWGASLPLGYAVGAIRYPDRPAVIDERGALSYAEIDQRTTRLAQALRARGIHSNTRVGVLCRNHHGAVEAMVACGKLGVDVVLLNTGLGHQQLADVLSEHGVRLLFADTEFAGPLTGLPQDVEIVHTWTDGVTESATLEYLIACSSAEPLPHPPRQARMIVLTSGTTGAPKGALRPEPPGLSPAATVLSRIPLREGERMLICSPLFHTWGLGALQLGVVLGATIVLHRRFDPDHTLAAIQRHRCTSMFLIPLMLRRLLAVSGHHDHSSLRIVASSGAALPAELASRFQHAFGPVLYNLYGSTEVSWVSIADPRDLLHSPGTAGRPPRGTILRILDEDGHPVEAGRRGHIYVGNDMLFDGYTSGKDQQRRQGLMPTGDVGFQDESGRLFVVGRADDMIVSGGENVYPGQTEELITSFPEVLEAAVIGVDDAEFGQRLAAFVVLHEGQRLAPEDVRDRVKAALPRFAVPRDVRFVDSLPRNATGKVVPRELEGT